LGLDAALLKERVSVELTYYTKSTKDALVQRNVAPSIGASEFQFFNLGEVKNHGFEVDARTLPENVRVTHKSLFDGTLQGFALTDRPAFCFQGHPEASPGPQDIGPLFDRFVRLMERSGAPGTG